MVITFKISNLDTHPTKNQYGLKHLDLIDFLNINGDFEFRINEILILKQQYWNVGELAKQLLIWRKAGLIGNFKYQCIDAEEQDLFSLNETIDGFVFFSEWALENIDLIIDKRSLENFINEYLVVVKRQIKEELDLDASAFL